MQSNNPYIVTTADCVNNFEISDKFTNSELNLQGGWRDVKKAIAQKIEDNPKLARTASKTVKKATSEVKKNWNTYAHTIRGGGR